MARVKYSIIFLCASLTTYCIVSLMIFEKVYITSKIIVDEEFHLQLGEAYCKYEFDKWHPKVTTFPGLYLLSSVLLGPFNLCSTYWLRFISLLFSAINVILFYCLLNLNNDGARWQNVLSAVNLGLLPPLYFFSHVYYTDVTSLTMVLTTFLLSQKNYHYLASIFGLFAILFRQTNIIWVGMIFACYLLQELNLIAYKKPKKSNVHVSGQDLIQLVNILRTDLWVVLKKLSLQFWLNTISYASLLIFFLVFIFINGSIVVGDKSAHEATIHIPQLFYFSIFCLFFAWPHFITEILNFSKFINKCKIFVIGAVILSLVIVHLNTLVHPYMLADNRHYVFYIWNRFYGKYFLFRYLMVAFYTFSWFVIITKLWDNKDVTFILTFIPCTAVVLITQKLLELRYFFIPFVLFRIRLKNVKTHSLLYEFLTYCILNVCTLYIFFTKTIQWEDYEYPQRLIW